jgi:creatinine amidohydrolase
MAQEVQYERMRPDQIREARVRCPVAYIPIGTIEWHGPHNPIGLDTLKAHALCVRIARDGGGLVVPPLYFGENRENALLEAVPVLGSRIAAYMGLPEDSFEPGYMGHSRHEQDDMYGRLLQHILHQVSSLGFKVAAFCAGHYPLIDHAKAACHVFHQQTLHVPPERRTISFVFTGYELVGDLFPYAGDHAAYWETSLMMALDRPLVDLSCLPEDRSQLFGVGGKRPPYEASAEQGEKYVQAITARVLEKVRERLDNPAKFAHHNLLF